MKNIRLVFVCIFTLMILSGCGANSDNPLVFTEDVSAVNPDNISTFYGTYKITNLYLDGRQIHPAFTKGFATVDEEGLIVKIQWGTYDTSEIYVYEKVTSRGSLADFNVIIRPEGRGIRTEFMESGANMIFEKISDKVALLENEPFGYFADDAFESVADGLTGTYEVVSGYFQIYTKENGYAVIEETCYAEPGGQVSLHMPSETVVYRINLSCASGTGAMEKNTRLEAKRSPDTFTARRWSVPPSINDDGTLNLTIKYDRDNFIASGEVKLDKIYNAFRMFY